MFPGCAGPSCPRVRGFNMRPAPGIVNGHSTTYGVFVLGQSLDVDIVEKRKIRQIRKCPDENRPAPLYRMVGSGGIPYQRGYGTRARTPGIGGRAISCPPKTQSGPPSQPCPRPSPALQAFQALQALLPLPPVQRHVQGRWEAGLSTASRGAQAGCMEGWVPPSRTPEERGCQT